MQIPEDLLFSLGPVKDFDRSAFSAVHNSGEQVTSIRINPEKVALEIIKENPAFSSPGKIPWSTHGYYLDKRPSFTSDPLLHAGAYYVQDASSMFLEQALKQSVDLSKSLKVLDLCAAPGGKSTLIQSLISQESLLVCNEVIKSRVPVLEENIIKWSAANVLVTQNDARDFQRLPGYFDVIVADAPCSGSGLFRKDPKAIGEWSLQQVEMCSRRQQRILADVMPALKPGGILIYATCSYSTSENEDIAEWLASGFQLQSLPLQTEKSWGITEIISPVNKTYGYRFFPHKLRGEGFFVSAFQMPITADISARPPQKKNIPSISKKEEKIVSTYINEDAGVQCFNWNKKTFAVSKNLWQELPVLAGSLYLYNVGIEAGTIIRDELLPAHALALSNLLREGLNSVELSKDDALNFLRREELAISAVDNGWVLVTYKNIAIGWLKKISASRMNNYYPKEWRILNK